MLRPERKGKADDVEIRWAFRAPLLGEKWERGKKKLEKSIKLFSSPFPFPYFYFLVISSPFILSLSPSELRNRIKNSWSGLTRENKNEGTEVNWFLWYVRFYVYWMCNVAILKKPNFITQRTIEKYWARVAVAVFFSVSRRNRKLFCPLVVLVIARNQTVIAQMLRERAESRWAGSGEASDWILVQLFVVMLFMLIRNSEKSCESFQSAEFFMF